LNTLRFAGGTDRGRRRDHNEDAYSIHHGARGGFVVADGLGGHAGGEVASRLACESIDNSLSPILNGISGDMETQSVETAVLNAMGAANETVREEAAKDAMLTGMGCTLLAAVVHTTHATITQVGDCRAYRWHAETLTQLTTDHTVVADMIAQGLLTPEQAQHHPHYHVLERAVGIDATLHADVRTITIQPEDRLLFCSDGLWNMLDDDQLAAILSETKDAEPCVSHLINEANHMGGEDNITVIVIDVIEGGHT